MVSGTLVRVRLDDGRELLVTNVDLHTLDALRMGPGPAMMLHTDDGQTHTVALSAIRDASEVTRPPDDGPRFSRPGAD
jgi:hypothetical protein